MAEGHVNQAIEWNPKYRNAMLWKSRILIHRRKVISADECLRDYRSSLRTNDQKSLFAETLEWIAFRLSKGSEGQAKIRLRHLNNVIVKRNDIAKTDLICALILSRLEGESEQRCDTVFDEKLGGKLDDMLETWPGYVIDIQTWVALLFSVGISDCQKLKTHLK